MPTAMDSSYTGIGNVQNIPAEQRIYGKTKEILKITKGRIPMMRIMTENMGAKMSVTDMHIKYKSDYALQALVDVSVASTVIGTTATSAQSYVGIPNAQAVRLREGARLFIDRIYYNGTTWEVGTGADYLPVSAANSQRECIKILEKVSVGATDTTFRIERGYRPAKGYSRGGDTGTEGTGTGTGGDQVQITTSMKLLLSLVPQAIGDNTGGVYGDTPHQEWNYCEITLEKMGVARTAERIDMYQTETILQRNSARQTDLFWKKNELKATFGRRKDGADNVSPVDGSYIYETGGIDEYIKSPQPAISFDPYPSSDIDPNGNIINFAAAHGAVNYQSLNECGRNKFYTGSNVKWWVCDDIQYTKISNCFDNKVRINYNQGMSLKYGFKINDLEISGGGTFHLVQSDLFSIYGLKNQGYIIDFDHFKPINLQGEDFTILVDVEKGLNPLKRVDYLYMNRGYFRTNPFAHYFIYNL